MEPKDRRLAILMVTPEFILGLMKCPRAAEVIKNKLPDDARITGVGQRLAYDPDRHAIALVLQSETFAAVPEGEVLPVLESPTFQIVAAPGEAELKAEYERGFAAGRAALDNDQYFHSLGD